MERSYADRADGATDFDPELQFDKDIDKRDLIISIHHELAAEPVCQTCLGDGFIGIHANLPDVPCPACTHPSPAAPVPASVREALAKAIGMFNDKIRKFDMDIPACLRDGQDRYAENLTAQRERFAGYVSALASHPAPEAAPTQEETIEQCLTAARAGFEKAMEQYVLIGPSGMAMMMINSIKALKEGKC